jgi:hypothetical protein
MTKETMSMQELLMRQVSALVSATADAVLPSAKGKNVLEIEADFYHVLAINCAEKQKLCAGFAKTATPQRKRAS